MSLSLKSATDVIQHPLCHVLQSYCKILLSQTAPALREVIMIPLWRGKLCQHRPSRYRVTDVPCQRLRDSCLNGTMSHKDISICSAMWSILSVPMLTCQICSAGATETGDNPESVRRIQPGGWCRGAEQRGEERTVPSARRGGRYRTLHRHRRRDVFSWGRETPQGKREWGGKPERGV